MVEPMIAELFAASPDVRYVAVRRGEELELRQRAGILDASAAESDRYEELLVNPTLLTLVGQRGAIDCGGLLFVLIRYGNFFQFVCPAPFGHVSVALEPESEPLGTVSRLREIIAQHASAWFAQR